MHSSEEDTENEMVLRPADYDFPLTRRPRESLQLRPDGTLIKGSASPSDSVQEHKGTWRLEDDDELALYTSGEARPSQKLKIASIHDDRLVLKKD